MQFRSILFGGPGAAEPQIADRAPDFFQDLNLDQIVDAATAQKAEYDLKPFYYTALHDLDDIAYRHEVMRDLEDDRVFGHLKSFERAMRAMRQRLQKREKLYYALQKQRWFLGAVDVYCTGVSDLVRDLAASDIGSCGLVAFRSFLEGYVASDPFTRLHGETESLQEELDAVTYCVTIRDGSVQVRACDAEPDYGAEIEQTFRKFQQGDVKDYRVKFSDDEQMNHVEARILDFVAALNSAVFGRLSEFCERNADFLDRTIARFDREIQFSIAWLEHIEGLKRAGLPFCYPRVSDADKSISAADCFDVALAAKLVAESATVVRNDVSLEGPERIIVVSGPNQGGKSTFARMVGQLHFLASIGCPVPGREARLFLPDRLFTHFENEEDIGNLRGKLQDDLVRLRSILRGATSDSIVIMNEIFTSASLQDAVFLSRRIIDRLLALDLLCVWVTFIDELSSLSEKTVSMVSTVVPENPAVRTFKILRRPSDGLAYALSIAEKHRVTYPRIKERIAS